MMAILDLPFLSNIEVILKILPYLGEVDERGDSKALQQLSTTNTTANKVSYQPVLEGKPLPQLEKLGSLEGTGRQDDFLLSRDGKDFPSRLELHRACDEVSRILLRIKVDLRHL